MPGAKVALNQREGGTLYRNVHIETDNDIPDADVLLVGSRAFVRNLRSNGLPHSYVEDGKKVFVYDEAVTEQVR